MASRGLYEVYYTKQSEGDLSIFYGARTQRGHGIGSVLGGLFRRVLPFLESGAEILGKQALNVAADMIDGKSFKESAKDRLKEGIIEFDVSSSGKNYLDFSKSQVLVKVKLTRVNGVDITDADHVGEVNLFLHSLFQQNERLTKRCSSQQVVKNVCLSGVY